MVEWQTRQDNDRIRVFAIFVVAEHNPEQQQSTMNNTQGAKQCLVLSKHCHWVGVLLTAAPPTPLWRLGCVSWITLQIHTKILPSHVSFHWFMPTVLHLHLTLTSFSQRYVCRFEVQQRLLARKVHSGSWSLVQSEWNAVLPCRVHGYV